MNVLGNWILDLDLNSGLASGLFPSLHKRTSVSLTACGDVLQIGNINEWKVTYRKNQFQLKLDMSSQQF